MLKEMNSMARYIMCIALQIHSNH